MVRINLLPPEIGRRRRLKQILAMFITLLVMYVFLLLAVFSVLTGRVALAKRDLERAVAETQQYTSQVQEVDRIQAEVAALEEKVSLKSRVLEGNLSWVEVLEQIRRYTPNDVWVTAMELVPPDGVVLSCSTLGGPRSIATCNLSFMECPDFKDILIDARAFTVQKPGQSQGVTAGAPAGQASAEAGPQATAFRLTFKLNKPMGLQQPAAAAAPAAPEGGPPPADGGVDMGAPPQ